MSVNIEETADTAQNSIWLILCKLVGLSTTHMKMILFYSNVHSFARNEFKIVNGIFLQQNPRNCQHSKRSLASLTQSLNCFHINPIRLMLLKLCYYKNRSLPYLKNII